MSAPTKFEREKREKIKELGLFVRDSINYTSFENKVKPLSPLTKYYIFCASCDIRANIYIPVQSPVPSYINKELYDIDKEISMYYCNIDMNTLELHLPTPKYNIENLIHRKDLIEVFGETRAHLIIGNGIEGGYLDIKHIINLLTNEEKEKLYTHYNTGSNIPLTHVWNNTTDWSTSFLTGFNKSKKCFVELDLTKPLEELLSFVKTIKEDYNNDPNTFDNTFDILSGEKNIYKCELDLLPLYKKDNKKTIGGRLADILFIYDCRKAGLDNNYILDEINKYWTKTENLFKDKMQLKTLREYHSLAIDYIDNEKYKCYLSGYDISQK